MDNLRDPQGMAEKTDIDRLYDINQELNQALAACDINSCNRLISQRNRLLAEIKSGYEKPEGAIMKTILAQDVARPLEDLFYEIGFTEGEWLVTVEKVKNDD
jgi:hypothetical protein